MGVSNEDGLDGNEWERLVHRCLRIRYPMGDYHHVPDEHGGDGGIEGFSTDGCAFQCYSHEGELTVADLYERQRDKMSTDIKKFIDNRDMIARMLGPLTIRKWVFVVREHRSRQLELHATKKASEVLSANLPYVASDFRIAIVTADEFERERQILFGDGRPHLHVPRAEVGDGEVAAFVVASENSTLMANLDEKLSRIAGLGDRAAREELTAQLTHGYLVGQAFLDHLSDAYPDLHAQLLVFKKQQERHVTIVSRLAARPGAELLEEQLSVLRGKMLTAAPSIAPYVDDLVIEAIADWLMRCPLQIPVRASA